MINPEIDDIVRQLVLAHADGDIQAIAIVMINNKCEPEIKMSVQHSHAYSVNFGLDVVKFTLMSDVVNQASKPSGNRE